MLAQVIRLSASSGIDMGAAVRNSETLPRHVAMHSAAVSHWAHRLLNGLGLGDDVLACING
jgi:hypothetical protein